MEAAYFGRNAERAPFRSYTRCHCKQFCTTRLIVVVLAVVGCADDAGALLGVGADEVDLRVVVDLVVLIFGLMALPVSIIVTCG